MKEREAACGGARHGGTGPATVSAWGISVKGRDQRKALSTRGTQDETNMPSPASLGPVAHPPVVVRRERAWQSFSPAGLRGEVRTACVVPKAGGGSPRTCYLLVGLCLLLVHPARAGERQPAASIKLRVTPVVT